MIPLPQTPTLFPYTTLFRSILKRGKGGTEYKLATLKTGDVVGEMALIDIQPRSATARAVGQATLYVLDLDRKSTRLELQSHVNLVCRLLLEKKKKIRQSTVC